MRVPGMIRLTIDRRTRWKRIEMAVVATASMTIPPPVTTTAMLTAAMATVIEALEAASRS